MELKDSAVFDTFKKFKDSWSYENKWMISGFFALCLTLSLMPFPRTIALWTLGVFLLLGFIVWITALQEMKKKLIRYSIVILPPVIYFLLYLIYYILIDPVQEYLVDKLMFLLIPVLGLPLFTSDYFKSKLRLLFIFFVSGLLIICLYQFTRVTVESISFVDGKLKFEPQVYDPFVSAIVSRFFWTQLSNFEHPTYLAIKTVWAIVLLLFIKDYLRLNSTIAIILISVFSIFVFFLAAKAEILILVILLIYYFINRFSALSSRIFTLISVSALFFIFLLIGSHNVRIKQKISQIREQHATGKIDWKDFDPRTRSWFCSVELIKSKPVFGYGLNARNILAAEYRKRGYNAEADLKLNSHNQFLETQLTLGIPGTIVLFWMMITPAFLRRKTWKSPLILPFLVIVTVSMIFESILVRQWGIMFFVLFYCILTIPDLKSDKR